MRSVEKSAKTTDEAIELALAELGVAREDAKIEILTMPSKGIFGIGSKDALVRVSYEDSATAAAIGFLTELFKKFELDATVQAVEGSDFTTLDVSGSNLGILIGRRGETLDAFQYLTNLAMARKFPEKHKFIIDVEGYREKRKQTLINLAQRLAEKVKETGRNVNLEPMNPYERRIIHTELQGNPYVRTFSEGDEPYRKVVITKRR